MTRARQWVTACGLVVIAGCTRSGPAVPPVAETAVTSAAAASPTSSEPADPSAPMSASLSASPSASPSPASPPTVTAPGLASERYLAAVRELLAKSGTGWDARADDVLVAAGHRACRALADGGYAMWLAGTAWSDKDASTIAGQGVTAFCPDRAATLLATRQARLLAAVRGGAAGPPYARLARLHAGTLIRDGAEACRLTAVGGHQDDMEGSLLAIDGLQVTAVESADFALVATSVVCPEVADVRTFFP